MAATSESKPGLGPDPDPPTGPIPERVAPPPVPGNSAPKAIADIAALSHRGLVREKNEDSFIVFRLGRYLERVLSNIPESELPTRTDDIGHLMIIADGMGGHAAGEVASRSALMSALQMILRSPRWTLNLDDPSTRDQEIQALIARGRTYLAAVHAALRAQSASDERLEGMGTTLTGAYTVGRDLFLMHVGDSKAFLYREGELSKLTHDHTVAQHYADLGVIPQEAVPQHRGSHMLTRAVGAPVENLKADMHHLRIEHGDRLLLCSDGLTDMATLEQIAAVLKSRAGSADACQSLIDLALAGGGRDNVTAIVAEYRID